MVLTRGGRHTPPEQCDGGQRQEGPPDQALKAEAGQGQAQPPQPGAPEEAHLQQVSMGLQDQTTTHSETGQQPRFSIPRHEAESYFKVTTFLWGNSPATIG